MQQTSSLSLSIFGIFKVSCVSVVYSVYSNVRSNYLTPRGHLAFTVSVAPQELVTILIAAATVGDVLTPKLVIGLLLTCTGILTYHYSRWRRDQPPPLPAESQMEVAQVMDVVLKCGLGEDLGGGVGGDLGVGVGGGVGGCADEVLLKAPSVETRPPRSAAGANEENGSLLGDPGSSDQDETS